MKVFLLAAGFGSRLRPLTDTVPKPLLPILNRPILEWMIAKFQSFGFSDFVINSHYLPGSIRSFCDGLSQDSKIRTLNVSHEPEIKGTGGALVAARNHLFEDLWSDCLVHNGDILSGLNFAALKDYHLQYKPMVTMALREGFSGKDRVVWAEEVNGLLYVREISKRSLAEVSLTWRNIRPYSFLASYCAHSSLLDYLSSQGLCDLIESINLGLASGKEVLGFQTNCYWEDIGNPLILLDSNLGLLDELRRKLGGLRPGPMSSLLDSCPSGFMDEFCLEALVDHSVLCPKDDWKIHKYHKFQGLNVIGESVSLAKDSSFRNCLILSEHLGTKVNETHEDSILGAGSLNLVVNRTT